MFAELIEMTAKEWREKGKKLFGENIKKWKFKCPSCGNIQTINDLRKYKNQGANPSDVYFNCIGRFSGEGGDIGGTVKPCNYTTGGLINLSPVVISCKDDIKVRAFDFAD